MNTLPHSIAEQIRVSVLSQFEPDLADALQQFGMHLARVNADWLVFMARKSLCIYDLMGFLGLPPAQGRVVSDRVLDLPMDLLRGKRVALIDDVLILGTSLAKGRRRLESEAGVHPSIHVCCVDHDEWCRDLLPPEQIEHMQIELDSERIMVFSSAEIRALMVAARPYIVDFPLSGWFHISARAQSSFLSSVEWLGFCMTTDLQRRHGAQSYSFLPAPSVLRDLRLGLGDDLMDCLEIIKARVFGLTSGEDLWQRVVPICTLAPLDMQDTHSVASFLLDRLSEASGSAFVGLRLASQNALAASRISQYILSAAVGEAFRRSTELSARVEIEPGFDPVESVRLFGHGLAEELAVVHVCCHQAVIGSQHAYLTVNPKHFKVQLPAAIASTKFPAGMEGTDEFAVQRLVTGFFELFVAAFNDWEMLARQEVHRLGRKVLENPECAPHLDRLDSGIPWGQLVDHLRGLQSEPPEDVLGRAMTLVLDIANDLGVVVPVICIIGNVVLRAYRHGEPVRLSDTELALSQLAVKGWLEGSQEPSIARVPLQKLLVLLVRAGLAKQFLEPVYGTTGTEGTVSIRFELIGGVAVVHRGPRFATGQETWLSNYMLERGALVATGDRRYRLGKPLRGNYRSSGAAGEAQTLGYLLGLLSRSVDPSTGRHYVSPVDLTLLASCWSPSSAAATLSAEVFLASEWLADRLHSGILAPLRSGQDPATLLDPLLRGKAHIAVHQGILKYLGYINGQPQRILTRCEQALLAMPNGGALASMWSTFWPAQRHEALTPEKKVCDPIVREAALWCWEAAMELAVLQMAIRAKTRGKALPSTGAAWHRPIRQMQANAERLAKTKLAMPDSVRKLTSACAKYAGRAPTSIEADAMVDYVGRSVMQLRNSGLRLVDRISPAIDELRNYGEKHEYAYLVHYDIKDSQANRAIVRGDSREEQLKRVRLAQDRVNIIVRNLEDQDIYPETELFAWNGDVGSRNDEKHVFLGGAEAFNSLRILLAELLSIFCTEESAHARIMLVPCNFVGTSAFRFESLTEVEGSLFWTHFSRLKRQLRTIDDNFPHSDDYTFLATAAGHLTDLATEEVGYSRAGERSEEIDTEIEGLYHYTPVRYAWLHPFV